mmetsp:Transcript_61662/g.191581  ORF Transcript_61662/g.191581 Transcript_61662/m.191581 type:complete len:200 (+) Transcript_61662:403-1002(+)
MMGRSPRAVGQRTSRECSGITPWATGLMHDLPTTMSGILPWWWRTMAAERSRSSGTLPGMDLRLACAPRRICHPSRRIRQTTTRTTTLIGSRTSTPMATSRTGMTTPTITATRTRRAWAACGRMATRRRAGAWLALLGARGRPGRPRRSGCPQCPRRGASEALQASQLTRRLLPWPRPTLLLALQALAAQDRGLGQPPC